MDSLISGGGGCSKPKSLSSAGFQIWDSETKCRVLFERCWLPSHPPHTPNGGFPPDGRNKLPERLRGKQQKAGAPGVPSPHSGAWNSAQSAHPCPRFHGDAPACHPNKNTHTLPPNPIRGPMLALHPAAEGQTLTQLCSQQQRRETATKLAYSARST